MFSYCIKCRKNTENENAQVARTKKWKNQNVKCVIVNKLNLSKSKKLGDY